MLRRLCRPFPKNAYKRVVKLANKERYLALKEFRELKRVTHLEKKEIQDIQQVSQEFVKKLHKIGQHNNHLKTYSQQLHHQFKHVKKLERFDNKEKRLERHIKKLHATHEEHEKSNSKHEEHDIKKEERALRKEEKEETAIESIERQFKKFDHYVQTTIEHSTKLSAHLAYFIRYVTRAIQTAMKFKKNPGKIEHYLEKVANYADKSIGNLLRKLQKEEGDLGKEMHGENGLFKKLNHATSHLARSNDTLFKPSLHKQEKHLKKIEQSLVKRFADVKKQLKKDEKNEKKARRRDARLTKQGRKSGINEKGTYTRDAGKQTRNIAKELHETEQNETYCKHELGNSLQQLHHLYEHVPSFKAFEGRMFKGSKLRSVTKKFSKEDHDEKRERKDIHYCIARFDEWKHEFVNVKKYQEFLKSLGHKARDEKKLLIAMKATFEEFSQNEKQLLSLFDQLKKSLEHIGEWEQHLEKAEHKLKDYLEDPSLFQETKQEVTILKEEIHKIINLEHVLNSAIDTIPRLERTIQTYDAEQKELLREVLQGLRLKKEQLSVLGNN
ncbi:MAG: hypothetical protein ACQESC_01610 [Nanobdellota archaeon]